MSWDNLKFVVALRRHGSLGSAARSLGVNETTVGRRLAALEEQLGARLVERTTAGWSLTDAGQRAADTAEAIERQAMALERDVGGGDTEVSGVVRITTPSAFVGEFSRTLAELMARYRRLRFHVIGDVMTLDLLKREADIAVRMVNPGQPSLLARRVGEQRWAVYATEEYLRIHGTPGPDLAGHLVIGYDSTLAGTPGGRFIAERVTDDGIVARANNALAAAGLAAGGLGLAVLPTNIGDPLAGIVRASSPPALGESPIFLVVHADLARVPRVRTTLDALAQHFSQREAATDTGSR